jgi:hypothetical protein
MANARWVGYGGNTMMPFDVAKLRRGESQERCECEIKLTRAQREETVKRVTKP